jgi:hypothetical protein
MHRWRCPSLCFNVVALVEAARVEHLLLSFARAIGSRSSVSELQDLFGRNWGTRDLQTGRPMAEARALNVFNSCKQSPIPVYVRLLTCFMSAIKNRTLKGQDNDREGKEETEAKGDVFVALADTNALYWADQEVADAIKKLLKQSGPVAFKGASKPAQR